MVVEGAAVDDAVRLGLGRMVSLNACVGTSLGIAVGSEVSGKSVGTSEGSEVITRSVGIAVGSGTTGRSVGIAVGSGTIGKSVGIAVGSGTIGRSVGNVGGRDGGSVAPSTGAAFGWKKLNKPNTLGF
jgi:hypothetical protein